MYNVMTVCVRVLADGLCVEISECGCFYRGHELPPGAVVQIQCQRWYFVSLILALCRFKWPRGRGSGNCPCLFDLFRKIFFVRTVWSKNVKFKAKNFYFRDFEDKLEMLNTYGLDTLSEICSCLSQYCNLLPDYFFHTRHHCLFSSTIFAQCGGYQRFTSALF